MRLWPKILKIFVCASPLIYFAIRLAAMVRNYGGELPIFDDWSFLRTVGAAQENGWRGVLSAAFASHGGHRLFLPKLLWLALFEGHGSWSVRLQMAWTVGFGIATATLLCAWIYRHVESWLQAGVAALAVSYFLLSFAQSQNWLWGFQTAWLMVSFFAIPGIMLFEAGWRKTGIAFCALSALCCGQGYLSLPALLGALLWSQFRKADLSESFYRWAKRSLLTLLIVTAAGCVAFPHLTFTPWVRAIAELIGAPLVMPFLLPHFRVATDDLGLLATQIAGLIFLVCWGAVFFPKHPDTDAAHRPLLTKWLAAFVLLNILALVTTRVGLLGERGILQSRYLTIVSLLPGSLVLEFFLRKKTRPPWLAHAMAGFIALFTIAATVWENRAFSVKTEYRLTANPLAKAAFLLWPATRVQPAERYLAPLGEWSRPFSADDVDQKVALSLKYKIFDWPIFTSREVSNARIERKKRPGKIEYLKKTGAQSTIHGWNVSAAGSTPCDLVVPLLTDGERFLLPKDFSFVRKGVRKLVGKKSDRYGWIIKFDQAAFSDRDAAMNKVILAELDASRGKLIINSSLKSVPIN